MLASADTSSFLTTKFIKFHESGIHYDELLANQLYDMWLLIMRKNVYFSVCVVLMAIAAAWWNLMRSDRKSLPQESAGLLFEEQVTVSQHVEQSNAAASTSVRAQNGRRVELAEVGFVKGAKQNGVQKDSVAAIEKSSPDGEAQDMQKPSDVPLESVDGIGKKLQAVRLADDFVLPSAMMHMAAIEVGHGGAGHLTPEVKAAVDHIFDDFYRDVVKAGEFGSNATVETEESSKDHSDLNSTVESCEETRVIAPTEETMHATEKANKTHQLLFGDDAANRYGVQSKLEVRLPMDGQK